jgi:hypothetical protein
MRPFRMIPRYHHLARAWQRRRSRHQGTSGTCRPGYAAGGGVSRPTLMTIRWPATGLGAPPYALHLTMRHHEVPKGER